MPERNFSTEKYWNKTAEGFIPEYSFTGQTKADWEKWRAPAFDSLMRVLGAFPKKAPLNPHVEYTIEDGELIRQKVIIDSEEYCRCPVMC